MLEIHAGVPLDGGAGAAECRRGVEVWLPGAVGHSVVTDRFRCQIVQPQKRARSLPPLDPSQPPPGELEAWAAILER